MRKIQLLTVLLTLLALGTGCQRKLAVHVPSRVEVRPQYEFVTNSELHLPPEEVDTVLVWEDDGPIEVELSAAKVTIEELRLENKRLLSLKVSIPEKTITVRDTILAEYFATEDSLYQYLWTTMGDSTVLIQRSEKTKVEIPGVPDAMAGNKLWYFAGLFLLALLAHLFKKNKKN